MESGWKDKQTQFSEPTPASASLGLALSLPCHSSARTDPSSFSQIYSAIACEEQQGAETCVNPITAMVDNLHLEMAGQNYILLYY